jgi:hypothetical protein
VCGRTNVGKGSVDNPQWEYLLTSEELMFSYDGTTMADTWVWQRPEFEISAWQSVASRNPVNVHFRGIMPSFDTVYNVQMDLPDGIYVQCLDTENWLSDSVNISIEWEWWDISRWLTDAYITFRADDTVPGGEVTFDALFSNGEFSYTVEIPLRITPFITITQQNTIISGQDGTIIFEVLAPGIDGEQFMFLGGLPSNITAVGWESYSVGLPPNQVDEWMYDGFIFTDGVGEFVFEITAENPPEYGTWDNLYFAFGSWFSFANTNFELTNLRPVQ